MNTKLIGLALLASLAVAGAADKPTIYNHVVPENAALDERVNAALAPAFTIIDIADDKDYVPPKAIAGRLPRLASTPKGEPLGGTVLVAYVVSTEGRAVSPIVLDSTDERLDPIALKAMEEWRFEPAALKGVAISTTAAQPFTFETTPTEFVTQVLEPTGGKMPRPKDWFYAEAHRSHSFIWTVSREDATGGKPYTTGVRIQVFADVEKGTGKTPKQFVLDFAEAKKKEATKVIKSCDPEEAGLFMGMCLETEEGPYHILYSLSWAKSMDMAAVVIAGTDAELWSTYAPAFDKMRDIELIDMKRFEK